MGLARTYEDRVEIFLRGPELGPSSPVIRQSLQFGPWYARKGSEPVFEASRLILPAQGHFDQVAAFICVELLRAGADTDLPHALAETEPLIALLFERLWLSDSALLGVAGELLVLAAVVEGASDEDVAVVVEGWAGWQRSLRDLTLGSVGVEIKTTTRTTSSHQIQGTHQIEADSDGAAGMRESRLFLVSVGLKRSPTHENTVAVPTLVESIVTRLRVVGRDDVAAVLLARVREYGAWSGFGYDHLTMSTDPAFAVDFEVGFVRAYDMSDPNVAVLRRSDVLEYQHVEAASLSYVLDLPPKVTGDLNPIAGLQKVAAALRSTAGFVK